MNYLKKLLTSLKTIIIIYILQYLIIFITSFFYLALGYNNLEHFISNELSIILTIINLIIVIYLIKKYKIPNKKLMINTYFPLIFLGISTSCFLNMLIFLIIKPTPTIVTTPLYISLISSGIIGPILEEILFRYILLNNLNKFNPPKKSWIIATLIFALIHATPIKIVYALILGTVLNLIYLKTTNIKTNIVVHISANIISIFLSNFNIYITFLSLMGLMISSTLIKNKIK